MGNSDKEQFLRKRLHLNYKRTAGHSLEYDWLSVTLTKAENYHLALGEINPRFFQEIAFLGKDKDFNISTAIKSEDSIRRFINEGWVKGAPIDDILMADCIIEANGSESKANALYMVKMINKGKDYLIPKLNEQLLQDLRIAQNQIYNALGDDILISSVVDKLYDFNKMAANSIEHNLDYLENIGLEISKKDPTYLKKHFTNYLIYKFKELRGEKVKSNTLFNAAVILIAPLFIAVGYFATKAIKRYLNILPKELRTLKSLVGFEILLFVGKKTNIEQFVARFASIVIDSEEFNKIINFSEANSSIENPLNSNNRPWEESNYKTNYNPNLSHKGENWWLVPLYLSLIMLFIMIVVSI